MNTINLLHSKAKAFIFPPEEDFWLVPIAAMASWTPVIAYNKWGATETVIDWKTGVFFDKQDVDSLNNAIKKYELINFDSNMIREYSKKFDKKVFKNNILYFINKRIKD